MTPSQAIVADAIATTRMRDDSGRELVVRRPTAIDRLRLYKAVGPVLAENSAYLGTALLASSVSEIDGIPVPAPTNENQIEALVGRLGDVGLEAIARTLDEFSTLNVSSSAGN